MRKAMWKVAMVAAAIAAALVAGGAGSNWA